MYMQVYVRNASDFRPETLATIPYYVSTLGYAPVGGDLECGATYDFIFAYPTVEAADEDKAPSDAAVKSLLKGVMGFDVEIEHYDIDDV